MSDQPTYNEPDLLLRIAKGEEAAFEQLFRRHHPPIYRVGLHLTGSPELAEEIVQDVFLKIWINRRQLGEIDNLQSYLFIVARNQAYRTHRKQLSYEPLANDAGGIVHTADIEERLTTQELDRVLKEAVLQLPPRQQQVFRYIREQGMSREATARAMDLSPETVKKYLARALLQVRAYCLSRIDDPGLLLLLLYNRSTLSIYFI